MTERQLNRRDFIEAGMAGALASACAAPLALAGEPRRPQDAARPSVRGAPLYAAVFDERSPAARTFARTASRAGLPGRAIRGDVTDLWYGELYPVWKRGAAPLAGLTAYGALFCLEQLAWDHRLRVVHRGAHRLVRGQPLAHLMQSPLAPLLPSPRQPAERWPATLAASILEIDSRTGWQRMPPASRHCEVEQRVRSGSPVHADETLYSWVIA